MNRTTRHPRILLYSHDTYGLGHLRRSLSIAWQLYRDIPHLHQVLLTGSMVAGAFEVPPRLDLIKLPALSKRSGGHYEARALPLSLRQILTWREQMILQAVTNFQPDLVLVDKVAGGVRGELLPALHYLKRCAPDTRIVLGMRDIEDSPDVTRHEWDRSGTTYLHEHVYDAILLYGQQSMFDPVRAYGMSPVAASKLVPCGYLYRPEATRSCEAVRRELDIGPKPLVLVTVGGGGDGYHVMTTYLDMLRSFDAPPAYHSVLVAGPLMAQWKRQELARLCAELPVTFMAFTADLGSYVATSDLVVGMAGYNTVCEILSHRKRALLVPRVQTRAEQRIRATALAERGWARLLLPAELSPARLRQAIAVALDGPPPIVDLQLNGLNRISRTIRSLLQAEKAVYPDVMHGYAEVSL